jgi:hypothetical protein
MLRSILSGQLDFIHQDFDYRDKDPHENIETLGPVIDDLPDPGDFRDELDLAFATGDRKELLHLLGQLQASIDTAPESHLEEWIAEGLGRHP